MLEFFKRTDLDGWWVRKGLQELQNVDAVPEPEIIIAALHSIRKLNDFALAVRFLEAVQVEILMYFKYLLLFSINVGIIKRKCGHIFLAKFSQL